MSTVGRVSPYAVDEVTSAADAVLVHVVHPSDLNTGGHIHGGVILRLIDDAAGIAAVRYCGSRAVTVGIDQTNFLAPIYVGEVATFTAKVSAAWTTSMEVVVRVEAENIYNRAVRHTTPAYVTYVAVDENGKPRAAPPR